MADQDITELLQSIEADAGGACDERLFEIVYDELRAMAGARLAQERSGHTLQPTALVNEAYLRLVKGEPSWKCRAHFFGAAGEAMRRILIDAARRRLAAKRGGDAGRVTLHDLAVESEEPPLDLLSLDRALETLASLDQRLVEIVRLRYFAQLSIETTALLMERSPASIKRDWAYARAWLMEHMQSNDSTDGHA